MFQLLLLEIIPFSSRSDNILRQNENNLQVYASGSLGQWYGGKCNPTLPEHAIDSTERKSDWCSNINKTKTDYPWIAVGVSEKAILLTGIAFRSGCCYYDCCCDEGVDIMCECCLLYSWSLQGSNDNQTWKTVHKVEKDRDYHYCTNKAYDIKSEESFRFVRLIQDEPWPGCRFCICINKLELYGSTNDAFLNEYSDDNEDSVSIIGKLRGN